MVTLILGGRDKTDYEDLPEIHGFLKTASNISRIILIGESGHELARRYKDDTRYVLADSLEEAVKMAGETNGGTVVLMSPAAASFDMFKNVYDRGDQFKNLVASLS